MGGGGLSLGKGDFLSDNDESSLMSNPSRGDISSIMLAIVGKNCSSGGSRGEMLSCINWS